MATLSMVQRQNQLRSGQPFSPGPFVMPTNVMPRGGDGAALPPVMPATPAPNINVQPAPQPAPPPAGAPPVAPAAPGGAPAPRQAPIVSLNQPAPAPIVAPTLAGGGGGGGTGPASGLEAQLAAEYANLIANDPINREKLMREQFGLVESDINRGFERSLEDAGRRAAALGRIGMGATNTTFGDITSERNKQLRDAQTRLSIEGAQRQIADRLGILGAAGGLVEGQRGERIANAQIAAQDRATQARLEAEAMGLNAAAQRQAADLAFQREMARQTAAIQTAELEERRSGRLDNTAFRERAWEHGLSREPIEDMFRIMPYLIDQGGAVPSLGQGYGMEQGALGGGVTNYGANAAQAGGQAASGLSNAIMLGMLGGWGGGGGGGMGQSR